MNQKNLIPNNINEKIIDDIHNKIKPNIRNIFLKLFIVHSAVALITTSICPQLGVGLKTGIDLSHVFQYFGDMGCDLFCGFFFTSTSILVSFFFLTRDEIRFLTYHKTFLASVFTLVSIGVLLMFNTKLFVELSLLWLIGTLVGVVGTLEFGSFLIKKIQ